MARTSTQTGLDLLARARPKWLRGRRVGLLMHPASIDARLESARTIVARLCGDRLRALYGPQHGFAGEKQDNMIESGHGRDPALDIPVHSLYSETRAPTAAMLADIDLLLVDLQDVGTRVYTFEWTTALALEACAAAGKEIVVLDRPNPIGGQILEGNLIRPGYTSFVGLYPVPMRHALTLGELAALVNARLAAAGGSGPAAPVRPQPRQDGPGVRCTGLADLTIVPMRGWRRRMAFDDTGLPWVLPSPNIPTLDTAVVYPGAVLFEGTDLSEGRGTSRPFELIGAPWIDGERFADAMNARQIPGAWFRAAFFEPTFHKQARLLCGGCQVHVTDRKALPSMRVAVEMLDEFRREAPSEKLWRDPPYEYEHVKPPIDILYGSDRLRKGIDSGESPASIMKDWKRDEDAFRKLRQPFLLY